MESSSGSSTSRANINTEKPSTDFKLPNFRKRKHSDLANAAEQPNVATGNQEASRELDDRKQLNRVIKEMVLETTEPWQMLKNHSQTAKYDDKFLGLLPKTIRSMERKVEDNQDPDDREHQKLVEAVVFARQWLKFLRDRRSLEGRATPPKNEKNKALSDPPGTSSVTHSMPISNQGAIDAGPNSAIENVSGATASGTPSTPVTSDDPVTPSVLDGNQRKNSTSSKGPQSGPSSIPESRSPVSPFMGSSSVASSSQITIDDENSSIGSPLRKAKKTKKRKRTSRSPLDSVLAEMVLVTTVSFEMLKNDVSKAKCDEKFLDLLPKTIESMERRAKDIKDQSDEEHERLADALDYARNWYTLLLNRRSPKDPAKGSTGQMADSDTVETSSGTHDMLSSKQSSSMAGPDSAIEKVGAATTFVSPSGPVSDIPTPTSAAPATTLASTVGGARADKYTAVLRNSRDDTAGISNAIRTGMQQAL
jgi:hypothetical protein